MTDCARMEEPASHLITVFASKDLLGRDVRQVRGHFISTPTFLSKIACGRLLPECGRSDKKNRKNVT